MNKLTNFSGFLLFSLLSSAVSAEINPLGNDPIVIYNAHRYIFLKENAEDLTQMNVFSHVHDAETYLFHALERADYLGKIFKDNDSVKIALPKFKAFFERQANLYNNELLPDIYKSATLLELQQGQDDYKCMKRLIQKIDQRVADVLKVPMESIFRLPPKAEQGAAANP